ncbi:hypothetical protein DE146DRAFT_57787 [Phaeosphaeria sp. MPI-PUGE-AT-0046c]|nr:hypothetical protein DE146DRAFT_57787 [Phaeosphaeria sp. MPI-PUGE-AT-0046c]
MARRSFKRKQSPAPEFSTGRPQKQQAVRQTRHATTKQDKPDFRVAIDFGTTYTTIAFSKDDGVKNIFTIEEFPGDNRVGSNGTQVPTELWYLTERVAITTKKAIQTDTPNALYGYEIRRRLEMPERHALRSKYKESGIVTMPKLLLDDSAHLGGWKADLRAVLLQLRKERIIKKEVQVIEDLLSRLLRHTKSVLERDHGLTRTSTVEVTIAVPVCWSARSNAAMNECLQAALSTVQFGSDGTTIPRLFMVNEAEAAAMHVLADGTTKLEKGDCFILLDCGGGTTDIGIYTIAMSHPLRLGEQVVHPKGAVCGSSDINARMRAKALEDLQGERYLEDADVVIENIIDSEIMPHFEEVAKRSFEITDRRSFNFRLRGLRESNQNPRLQRNHYVLTFEDMFALFDESIRMIKRILEDQIELARDIGVAVDSVVLVGGFGDSPALKEYLKLTLDGINAQHGGDIRLESAAFNTSAAGVAKGALMRAQDKTNGPKHVPCRSIGVTYHIPDDPSYNFSAEILGQRGWEQNDINHEWYLKGTIWWLIKAGVGEIRGEHVVEWNVMHPFGADEDEWIVVERLFGSDTCVDDFYTRHHTKNRGKTTEFGSVEFDVTHLKDRVTKQTPAHDQDGVERYEITLRVQLKVIGRNMEFTAYWPVGEEDAEVIPGSQKSFDMTSVFPPGAAF